MTAEVIVRIVQVIAGILVFLLVRFAWDRYHRARTDHAELSAVRTCLEDVLNNLRDGVVVVNRDLEVLFANEAATPLVAVRDGKRILDPEQGLYQLTYETGAPMPRDDWPTYRAFRGIFEKDAMVFLHNIHTSEVILREVTSAPFKAPNSSKPHVMITFRDITATRNLEESRTRLSSIVESSDDAIIGKDIRGVITSWNLGAERIFGYTAAEMLGQSIARLLPPDNLDEEALILSRILNNETVDHFNTTRITKDGRTIHVSLTISPIRDRVGKIIGASKIARDLTGLRNLEDQLRRSQKMEALGQLTGGIAHDFNNLLGIILGNIELLEGEIQVEVADREQGRRKIARTLQHARTACNAATRAADLTRRLLTFSSAGQLKPANTCLHTAVRNTLSMASRALGPTIQVETELDPSSPQAYIDPAAFESALLNLIVNARDAMLSGGLLRVATRVQNSAHITDSVPLVDLKAGPHICISVTDNGVGMSPHTLERAFEPFYTTKPQSQGTGLGLSMVYGFLRQSNGTAHIESEPGHGTTVSMYLPLVSGPATQPLPQAKPLRHAHRDATVLLVDDQPELLQIGVSYLSELGYKVLTAEGPAAALALLSETADISLLISDILMPGGIDGVTFAEQVHAALPGLPIIFTSGFHSSEATQDRLTAVSDAQLYKPYRLTELGEVVARVLEPLSDAAVVSA